MDRAAAIVECGGSNNEARHYDGSCSRRSCSQNKNRHSPAADADRVQRSRTSQLLEHFGVVEPRLAAQGMEVLAPRTGVSMEES